MTPGALRYREIRLCSNGGGYEALPEGNVTLDLAGVRGRVQAAGTEVVDARVMLIVRHRPELTVGRSGRVLVKSDDPIEARAALDWFFESAGLDVRFRPTVDRSQETG